MENKAFSEISIAQRNLTKLESKIKLAFDMYIFYSILSYDFDNDGLISKEDIRIVLSYISI